MHIGILSFKGGQAKTTTSIHLAAFLSRQARTVLIDYDTNQSALTWASQGELPFVTVGENQTGKIVGQFTYYVHDTKARPLKAEIDKLETICRLLVLPVTPDALSLDVLRRTLEALGNIDRDKYRVLLTICPPFPSHDAEDARRILEGAGLPLFKGQIRRAVAFQRAALAGVTVDQVADPRAAECWADYEGIGNEILAILKG